MRWIAHIALSVLSLGAVAQHAHEPVDTVHTDRDRWIHPAPRFGSVRDVLHHMHFGGHVRNHAMATINNGPLHDHFTNATGGSIHFETPDFWGLRLGVGGIFTFNTIPTDLERVDSISGRRAGWERELYDVSRPGERKDLDRLEELYVSFHYGRRSFLTYGKIDIDHGPLLQRHDGRMKPFVYKGFWSRFGELGDHDIYLGWIDGVSPRGLTEWYPMHEALGILSNGLQPDGSTAGYHDHVSSRGMAVAGFEGKAFDGLSWSLWNHWLHRAVNIAWMEARWERGRFIAGLQYVFEAPMPYEAGIEFTQRYMQPDERAHVVSGRLGIRDSARGIEASINYLHGFATGRFLYPRELGRDVFFVSHSRTRMDGLGDMDVVAANVHLQPMRRGWERFEMDLWLTRMMTSSDPAFNKYGLPSFYQGVLDLHYHLPGVLDGIELRLLYVSRWSDAAEAPELADQAYRTNLHHINFVTNVHF